MNDPGHRHHDLGGRPAGRCLPDDHQYEAWEKRVDALVQLLNRRAKVITTDEMRRNIEELGPTAYDEYGYYERWMHGVTQTLLQRGLIDIDELGRKMAEIEARERHG